MPDITQILVGQEGGSVAAWARRRRERLLLERFPDIGEMRVLDLGGEVRLWTGGAIRPREAVLLNLEWQAEIQQQQLDATGDGSWIRAVGGDACDPPQGIRDERFDLVFSNSVIEHVGGHERREAFAWFANTLAEHHWIQTPNRYFPVEPHWLFPGFQFLPVRTRAAVTQFWPIGNFTTRRDSLRQRLDDVLSIELLSPSEMRFYFPQSEVLRERIAGVTKSLVAVR